MPNFSNYNNVEANYTEGGFKQVIPGAYVAVVQVVRTNWTERNYDTGLDDSYQTITIDPATGMTRGNEPGVMFVFDIAEGEFAGEYSRDFYMSGIEPNPEKDFIHRWKFHWGDLNNEKDAAKAKYILRRSRTIVFAIGENANESPPVCCQTMLAKRTGCNVTT